MNVSNKPTREEYNERRAEIAELRTEVVAL